MARTWRGPYCCVAYSAGLRPNPPEYTATPGSGSIEAVAAPTSNVYGLSLPPPRAAAVRPALDTAAMQPAAPRAATSTRIRIPSSNQAAHDGRRPSRTPVTRTPVATLYDVAAPPDLSPWWVPGGLRRPSLACELGGQPALEHLSVRLAGQLVDDADGLGALE